MEGRRKIARGLITAHIITFLLSAAIGFSTNFVAGLTSFALILPVTAYLSPKIMEQLSNDKEIS